MAVIPAVLIDNANNPLAASGVVIVEWVGLEDPADVGEAVALPQYSDKTVQVTGDFGTVGVVQIEGSIEAPTEASPTYVTLVDPQGTALSIATADDKLRTILDNCVFIRPRISAGSGTVNLTVRLLAVTTR